MGRAIRRQCTGMHAQNAFTAWGYSQTITKVTTGFKAACELSGHIHALLTLVDSPNLLQFTIDALVLFSDWFIGETDLLACYDLFFVSGQKTTALFCLHSVQMTGRGQGHHGRQVCSFPKM
jgi:hypothetical protein